MARCHPLHGPPRRPGTSSWPSTLALRAADGPRPRPPPWPGPSRRHRSAVTRAVQNWNALSIIRARWRSAGYRTAPSCVASPAPMIDRATVPQDGVNVSAVRTVGYGVRPGAAVFPVWRRGVQHDLVCVMLHTPSDLDSHWLAGADRGRGALRDPGLSRRNEGFWRGRLSRFGCRIACRRSSSCWLRAN